TNAGFSIPGGSTIDGIVCEVEVACDVSGAMQDFTVHLTKNGSADVGSEKADATTYPTSDAYKTYGSSSDLWGATWTASDINSANFGLKFASLNNGNVSLATVSV